MLAKIRNRIRTEKLRPAFNAYIKMDESHLLSKFPKYLLGDCSGDPTERFSHYEGFNYWTGKKLTELVSGRAKILDLGNTKSGNAFASLNHDVTALVLKDCKDELTSIKYCVHDVSNPLPFGNNSFDVFTSCASIHLIGLGRYGDKINPNALPNLCSELDRVMNERSHLFFSTGYGPDSLMFNNGWAFSLETIKKFFSKWQLKEYLIDNHSTAEPKPYKTRYTTDLDMSGYKDGEYRIIFLHFTR